MAKGTIERKYKTGREVTDSELLNALMNSMGPLFKEFEEEIAKSGGKVLHIQVTASPRKVKLSYGFSDIDDLCASPS